MQFAGLQVADYSPCLADLRHFASSLYFCLLLKACVHFAITATHVHINIHTTLALSFRYNILALLFTPVTFYLGY